MLNFLRKGVKSIFAKVLLSLLIASFAVWGIGDIFSFRMGSAVANVGDTEITAERFADTMNRQQNLISQRERERVSYRTLRDAGVDAQVMASLIRDAAFTEELASMKIGVPVEAVRDTISSNPSFQDGQGGFSQFLYQTTITQQGYDARTFESLTRTLLGQQILADAVSPAGTSLPGIGAQIAAYRGEQRSIATIRLTPDMAADPGTPDDATLTAYFEANGDRFIEPERRWGSYVHVDIDALARTLAPTDEEIQAEYDANIDRYTVTPTRTVEQIVFDDRASAEAALDRVVQGTATYEEIAAEQNIALDEISLGTVSEQDVPEATAQAVFALTEPGIVGPVETTFGFAVLNVTGVEIGGPAPLSDVRSVIGTLLGQTRAQDAAPQKANEVDDARASGASMAEIAAQTGLELVTFAGISPRGLVLEEPTPSLAGDPVFMNEVASALDGEDRDLIEMENGSYALVRLERIVESHLPELATIRDRVVAAWQSEQRLQALEKQAEGHIARLSGEVDFAALGTELSAEVLDQPAFTREAPAPFLSADLLRSIFDADLGQTVAGRTRDDASVLMVEIRTITPLSGEALTSTTAQIDDAILSSISRDNIEYFARAIEARHGSHIDQGVVEQVFEQLSQNTGY